MLSPGAVPRLAAASAALVVAPALAWRAATAGALDGEDERRRERERERNE